MPAPAFLLFLTCAAAVAVAGGNVPLPPTPVPSKSNVCKDDPNGEVLMSACGASPCSGGALRVPLRRAFQLCDPCARSLGLMAVVEEMDGAFAITALGMGMTIMKDGECVNGLQLQRFGGTPPPPAEQEDAAAGTAQRSTHALAKPDAAVEAASAAPRAEGGEQGRRVALSGDYTPFLVLVVAVLGYVVFAGTGGAGDEPKPTVLLSV